MASRWNIETITNGLLAIQRIKQLYNPEQRDGPEPESTSLQPDRLTLLRDTLTVITDFLPATRGSSFSEAFRLGSHYSSAYRGIKQHFREMNGSVAAKGAGLPQLIKTLNIVAPVFSNRERVYMDKLIRIFNILDS